MNVYFVTASRFKVAEVRNYLQYLKSKSLVNSNLNVSIVNQVLQEILHPNIEMIVRNKALEAYQLLSVPCAVEHGGLFMDELPNLPGGVGQLIWDAVGERMCSFLRAGDSRAATARSIIGYCDGRRVHLYIGETRGTVAPRARGNYKFLWDPIFIPEKCKQTYGEMGMVKKRATSPSFKAWAKFLRTEFKTASSQKVTED
ncbi:MAG TPA: non-canonical purine NTP pyrophosphatase [Pyrinomonadaceae bacterium]|jgi:XTP/dITP diphosphohydrolase